MRLTLNDGQGEAHDPPQRGWASSSPLRACIEQQARKVEWLSLLVCLVFSCPWTGSCTKHLVLRPLDPDWHLYRQVFGVSSSQVVDCGTSQPLREPD